MKISKLLAGKSPDISKEKLQKGWLHYRIWHIGGGWHDGLYDIFISPNGEIEILKTSSADAYKSWKLVIKEPQNSFTNALSAIIDDPIPLLASRSRDGGPDSALTIMERYTNEEGYRWGVRSLYLTTKQSVVDLVQLFKPIDAKLEKIKSEAEGAKE